jgi:hypothetical protein
MMEISNFVNRAKIVEGNFNTGIIDRLFIAASF